MTRRVAVIGAGGYAGAALLGLLLRHPGCDVVGVFGSERTDAATVPDLIPSLRGLCDLPVRRAAADAVLCLEPDAVFLATPHQASAEFAPPLHAAGVKVFDLSGAFRLEAPEYPKHYGFDHPAQHLLREAVYGLVEHARDALAGANLVAVPGCYPTASILAIKPLADAGAIAAGRPIIIDAVSGVSGAGRAPSERTHFCEVSLQPYGVFSHRHQPEIERHAAASVVFTPHIAPFARGIVATIHIEPEAGWDARRIADAYADAYGDEPFVRVLPAGTWPSVAAVERTNRCDLSWALDAKTNHLILVSAIDNLVKGAAGQAVQAFNRRFDYPEPTALSGATP